MSSSDLSTLVIGLAALMTSCITAFQMVRQNNNLVRPAIVILEKYTTNEDVEGQGRSLFLVNMGNAMAMSIQIWSSNHVELLQKAGSSPLRPIELVENIRTEIAVNRRAVIATNYKTSVFQDLSMAVWYVDVNGSKYFSVLQNGKHKLGRGHPKKLVSTRG